MNRQNENIFTGDFPEDLNAGEVVVLQAAKAAGLRWPDRVITQKLIVDSYLSDISKYPIVSKIIRDLDEKGYLRWCGTTGVTFVDSPRFANRIHAWCCWDMRGDSDEVGLRKRRWDGWNMREYQHGDYTKIDSAWPAVYTLPTNNEWWAQNSYKGWVVAELTTRTKGCNRECCIDPLSKPNSKKSFRAQKMNEDAPPRVQADFEALTCADLVKKILEYEREHHPEPRVCLTPGSNYHIEISPKRVAATVDFPEKINLTEGEAIDVENRVHNGLEWALAALFKEPNLPRER